MGDVLFGPFDQRMGGRQKRIAGPLETERERESLCVRMLFLLMKMSPNTTTYKEKERERERRLFGVLRPFVTSGGKRRDRSA